MQLERFADRATPVVVWRSNGEFAELFIFLATRFLSAPDSVLLCEGVHSQWKWIEGSARGMKYKLLNAVLKITGYMHTNGGLPPQDDLIPHMLDARAFMRNAYNRLVQDGVVAPGLRRDWVHRERFNLRPQDVDLMKAATGGRTHPSASAGPHGAWSQYLRFLLLPHTFYQFTLLSSTRFVFVAENKSFQGRDAPPEGEPLGRPLGVAWFEKVDSLADGILVKPCDAAEASQLRLMTSTIAELSMATGFYPSQSASDTARDTEILHEQAFLNHGLMRYTSQRVVDCESPWNFVLSDPTDAEDHFVDTRAEFGDLTKMALARFLQKRCNKTAEWRDRQFEDLTKQGLLNLVQFGLGGGGAGPDPGAGGGAGGAAGAAPIAPGGGGRGRGIGRGVGPGGGGARGAAPIAPGGRGRVADPGHGGGLGPGGGGAGAGGAAPIAAGGGGRGRGRGAGRGPGGAVPAPINPGGAGGGRGRGRGAGRGPGGAAPAPIAPRGGGRGRGAGPRGRGGRAYG